MQREWQGVITVPLMQKFYGATRTQLCYNEAEKEVWKHKGTTDYCRSSTVFCHICKDMQSLYTIGNNLHYYYYFT